MLKSKVDQRPPRRLAAVELWQKHFQRAAEQLALHITSPHRRFHSRSPLSQRKPAPN